MELTYATPALLFPTVSLLFLAFTTRFISYANLIRSLHSAWEKEKDNLVMGQIENLRKRMNLIRMMQKMGASSLIFCTISMGFLYPGWQRLAGLSFAAALIFMLLSLILLFLEIRISMKALDMLLEEMEEVPPS